jgi:hypothetical protein
VSSNASGGNPSKCKSLKVGILDLAARQQDISLYARIVNPNQASIMPQVIGVWAEQLGHDVAYALYSGLSSRPPSFFHAQIKAGLGPLYDFLPGHVVRYLERGKAAPNPMIADSVGEEPGLAA